MRMTRREFIGSSTAAWACTAFGSGGRAESLSPDYWCTWGIQNRLVKQRERANPTLLAGDQGAFAARNNLTEQLIFDAGGWSQRMGVGFRHKLFMLLDDGWDVAFDSLPAKCIERFGALEPYPARFPSMGKTPLARLSAINARLKADGWQGAALWIAAQREGDRHGALAPGVEDFYRRRIELSARAGIRYWKVDWGVRSGNDFRGMVSRLAREICPELMVEHCPLLTFPFNSQRFDAAQNEFVGNGRAAVEIDNRDLVERMRFSDVIRTYDVVRPLGSVTTLDRTVDYSRLIDKYGCSTILNVEDAPIIAAVLGHGLGIMRDIDAAESPGTLLVRAVANWRNFAPVYGGRAGYATVASERILSERHRFKEGESWLRSAWNHEIMQAAPAIVARGLPLPEVKALENEVPYVLAGRHPGGALSVGTLPRLDAAGRETTPPVAVVVKAALPPETPLALFGAPRKVIVPVCGQVGELQVVNLATGGQARVRPTMAGQCLCLDLAELYAALSVSRERELPVMIRY
ncbi:MAG: hypothetical protein ACI4RD_01635 [Kiritimatiellia bacterium]